MKKCYRIYDSGAEQFGPQFECNAHGEAERTFRTLANDENSDIGKYPEHYTLYFMAEFNPADGKTELQEPPIVIFNGQQARKLDA